MNIGAHRNTEWTKKTRYWKNKNKIQPEKIWKVAANIRASWSISPGFVFFSFIIEKELHYHRAGAPCFEFWNVCSCDDQSKIWTLWIKMNRQLTKIIIDQYWLIQKTVFRMVMYCGMPGALVRTLNFHVWNRSHEISIKCIRNRGEKNSKPNEWSNDRLNFHTDCHVTQNYELKKNNNPPVKRKSPE